MTQLENDEKFAEILLEILGDKIFKFFVQNQGQDPQIRDLLNKILAKLPENGEKSLKFQLERILDSEFGFHSKAVFEILHLVVKFKPEVIKSIWTFIEHRVVTLQGQRGKMAQDVLRNNLFSLKKLCNS